MDIYQLTSPWIIPQVTNPSYEWIIQQVTNPGPKLVDNPPGLWISNLGISNLKIPKLLIQSPAKFLPLCTKLSGI